MCSSNETSRLKNFIARLIVHLATPDLTEAMEMLIGAGDRSNFDTKEETRRRRAEKCLFVRADGIRINRRAKEKPMELSSLAFVHLSNSQ